MPVPTRIRHARPERSDRERAGKTRPSSKPTAIEASIARHLADHIGAHRYDMWFGRTRLLVDGAALEVATDSTFVARWIESHFADEVRRAATEVLGDEAVVQVSVRPELFGHPPDGETKASNGASNGRGTGETRPRSGATRGDRPLARVFPGGVCRRLAEYVVGPSNKLAYAASCQVVEDSGAALISPLFIHGECGVGKTHLLQGICQRFTELSGAPEAVRYVTGEQFTNEYISAIRSGKLEPFRKRMRKLDLLAIDDVHFLSNKVRTQSEFLHTLDAIDLTGARLVLASDEHPRHIKRFSQALISRFLSGMVVQVERPDRETRLELIRRLATTRGLQLNATALESVAARCVGSVRELEGAITKLAALRTISPNGDGGHEVGLVLVEQLFNERTWQPTAPVRIGLVIDSVCDRLRISRSDLMGTGRHRKVVLARALVAHLSRELTTHSYPEIAQAIGRTYHSTVHTAAARLRRQMEADESVTLGGGEMPLQLRDLVDHLRHEIVRGSRSG